MTLVWSFYLEKTPSELETKTVPKIKQKSHEWNIKYIAYAPNLNS